MEVTCRTVQGRYLFRPSSEINEIIYGILGYAQGLHNVRICLVSVLSSHYHLLFDIDNAQQLAKFMHFVNSRLSKEVNRLTGWSGPVFAERYTAILVTGEEKAQVAGSGTFSPRVSRRTSSRSPRTGRGCTPSIACWTACR